MQPNPKPPVGLPEVEDLAEQIGRFIEYWGFKKVHGQIWCHLYLSATPLDAAAIMAKVGISKALVSISLKELQEFGLIAEVGKSPRGTRTYQATDDVVSPILATIRRRERRLISRIESSYSLLSKLSAKELTRHDLNTKRMSYLGVLIKIANFGLDTIVQQKWQNFKAFMQLRRPSGSARNNGRNNEGHDFFPPS